MPPPIAVGIAGCGYWGPNLARTFNGMPGAWLAAVCDLKDDRLAHMRSLYPNVGTYTNFDTMLQRAELDAVVIATPLHSHHALAKAALLDGKHVLIEKPMAGSTAECEDLIRLAAQQGLTLMIGHTYLYSEAVGKILEIIKSGAIGEIRYINCQRLNLGLFQQNSNVAWDLAPHDLSIILTVMGELPEAVNCQGNAHITRGVEDVTNMSLTFSGKRFATIQSSWLEPRKVRQMTFVGTRKMIHYDDLEPLEKLRIYDVRVDAPPHYDSFAEFHYSYHYGDCYIPRIDQFEPLIKMSRHFISCIKDGSEPDSSGRQGLEIVRILEASDRSLATDGCSATLPESPSDLTHPPRRPNDVELGGNVQCFDPVNLYGCKIGDETRIGCFVEIQRGVQIGARCKISSHSFICEGVIIEDGVFVGHGVIFTNDRRPKATNDDGSLQGRDDWKCQSTLVKRGASIGSGSIILGGITIGENALVGAGSVVTQDVLAHTTVAGIPARPMPASLLVKRTSPGTPPTTAST